MTEEAEKKIDIGPITRLHLATFTILTNIGPITLRPLSRLRAQRVGQELLMADPEYAEYVKEYEYLNDIMEIELSKAAAGDKDAGLTEEQTHRRAELTRLLAEWSDWYAIECFIEPELSNPDELEALSSELDIENFNQLDEMLRVLANPMPVSETNRLLAEICLKYDVPLCEGITAENMTVQQSALLDEVREAENRKMAELMEMARLGNGC